MADIDKKMKSTQKQTPPGEEKEKKPVPKALSKSETPLTNDPLWKESFVLDGETGLVSEEAAKEFNADASGYISLIDAEYKAISDVDRYYAKSIPASAHAYYHIILYWYELALISQKRGTASRYASAQIAAGAGEYLEALGDYTDSTGVRHLLRASEPNDDGDFGRITAQTHGLYETLPVPHISYERVIQDLLASERGNQPDAQWIPDVYVFNSHLPVL